MAALEPMDFLMHQPEAAATGQAQPTTANTGFPGLHQPQGCPYFRGQQSHGSSLPPPHFDPNPPFRPMPHQLPPLGNQQHSPALAPQSQPGPPLHASGSANGSHSQQQPAADSQVQTQRQHQPHLPQPPTLPPPQSFLYSQHFPYDPVHSSSAGWTSGPRQGTSWHHPSTTGTTPTLHPRPPGADPHFRGSGHGAGELRGDFASSSSPAQPFLPPTQQTTLPNLDPSSPFVFQGYQRSANYPLYQMSSSQNPTQTNQHGRFGDDQAGRSGQQQPNPVNQAGQPSQVANVQSPPVTTSAGRPVPPLSTRAVTLPSLNPNASQASGGPQSVSQRQAGPAAPATSASRPSAFLYPVENPGRSSHATGDGPSSAHLLPRLPLPSNELAIAYRRRAEALSQAYRDLAADSDHPAAPLTIPTVPAGVGRRRHDDFRRVQRQSEHESDDDLGSSADEEERVLRYMDAAREHPNFRAIMAGDHIRAAQIMRGQVPSKRVASKQALAQLQSVDLASLSDGERTCVICYNDFGQPSPEGIIEAPLRLPKCQHVFGDHCIKKWFEESDSCPYCRDKLPSEPAYPASFRAFQNFYRATHMRARQPPSSSANSTMLVHPPTSHTVVASSLIPLSDETLVRVYAQQQQQQQREVARARARQELESENITLRPFAGRERRSPPSDVTENRRRTRARHDNLHSQSAGPSTARASSSAQTAEAPAPGQQSPPRERVTSPSILPWPGQYAHDLNRILTTHAARQSVSGSQRPYLNPLSSGGPFNGIPPVEHLLPNPNMVPIGFAMSHGMPTSSMAPVPNPAYYPNLPYTSSPSVNFPQLPPIGPFDTANLQDTSHGGNGVSRPGVAEGQMQ
ncbi:uncharacterized protein B0T15DRAFT_507752 [Chaetomium strumarium]|uniref:RING-type domain-containing protein n=1 Tax=Chaetomium strumarium TaxID=1170767 RepID=A0AAJ0M6R8_9PEZI|nr:hypothetical protein B0T15DRAFT_507752 [Chaetomium strumarium]